MEDNTLFEDLPGYMKKELDNLFGFYNVRLKPNYPYHEWKIQLINFIETFPKEDRSAIITKGIMYSKNLYTTYSDKNPVLEQDSEKLSQLAHLERRIVIAQNLLNEMAIRPDSVTEETKAGNKEFTLTRQVLAIHFLLEYTKVENIDKTAKARFIQFITGRQTNATSIKNTDIYKKVDSPLSLDDKSATKDLQFVRTYFEDLGIHEVAKWITNEISKREK